MQGRECKADTNCAVTGLISMALQRPLTSLDSRQTVNHVVARHCFPSPALAYLLEQLTELLPLIQEVGRPAQLQTQRYQLQHPRQMEADAAPG